MTANENNRRYLAEAWIDEDKDEEFKKSFLENLLNQLEHHKSDRSGFDADMLDGKHYCEISKEIDEKVEGFLRDFSIGKVHIANENGNEYTLGFDAVTLFPNIDGYNESEKTLPWDETPREMSPSLMEVFRELYNQVIEKANQDDVDRINDTLYGTDDESGSDSLVGTVEELENTVSNITDENGNVNATYLNGIQIFIMSESAYAQESEANKNNIKHLYIVKPDNEIDTNIYPDGVVTDNPTVAELSRYYKFRIIDQTKDGVTQTWLQCRYEWGAEDENAVWQDIAPTSDFMDTNTIQELIVNYLAGSNYSLSPSVVKGAFDQITDFNKFDTTSLPTQWLLRNFLAGAKYQNEIVTLDDNTLIRTCPNQGNSMYLDLDALVDSLDIENTIDSKLNEYWKRIYPIGSIYMSMENTSPAELFGGTWEKIEGKFLLASDTNHELATTGGQEKVQLSNNNIPSHAHSHSHTHVAPEGMPYMVSKDDIKVNLDNYREWPKKVSSGGIHIVYAPKGAKYGIESRSNTGAASSQNTGNTGGGQAHENMPPYLSVNMWRRTA